ncbi:MAG: hypothetical protein WD939_05480 [Dehalococcoidia bacterium]
MPQQYDVSQIGKAAGLAIIAIGFIMAIWGATDLGDFAGGDDKFRYFVTQTLSWVSFGGLVYLAAEILDRVKNKGGQ